MDIDRGGQKISGIKTYGLAAGTAQQVALTLVFFVEPKGIPGKDISHGIKEIFFPGLNQDVDVIGHEAQGEEIQLMLLC